MKTCGSRASARCAAPERCVRPSRCRQSRPRSARGRSGARKSCLRQPEQFSTDPSGRRPRGARWRAQRARPRCSAGTCRACGISGAFSDSACRAVGALWHPPFAGMQRLRLRSAAWLSCCSLTRAPRAAAAGPQSGARVRQARTLLPPSSKHPARCGRSKQARQHSLSGRPHGLAFGTGTTPARPRLRVQDRLTTGNWLMGSLSLPALKSLSFRAQPARPSDMNS